MNNQITARIPIYHVPQKSEVASILLTLILGPIGLFYADIAAGLIMIFMPIASVLFYAFVIMQAPSFSNIYHYGTMFFLTFGLIFLIIYWPLCILWGVYEVVKYNRKMSKKLNLQFQGLNKQIIISEPGFKNDEMIEWLYQNPSKGIEDYYFLINKGLPQKVDESPDCHCNDDKTF